MRGAYREPFDNLQAALEAPRERLRADLALLPEIAEQGLARAAKDISQGGIPGTAAMLAESSGVVDRRSISTPSSRRPASRSSAGSGPFRASAFSCPSRLAHVEPVLAMFRARGLHAASIGAVQTGSEVTLHSEGAQRPP